MKAQLKNMASQKLVSAFLIATAAVLPFHASAQKTWTKAELLQKEERPTIVEIRSALGSSWNPTELPDGSALEKDPNKPYAEWQNNFKRWHEFLIKGGPKAIADFERAAPGATWVFMGRDMAAIADLFESFYLSIGQDDRVIRLGMSSGTLETTDPVSGDKKRIFDQTTAQALLSHYNIHPERKDKPFFFVDAISRKGGTQIRAVMHQIYESYRASGGSPAELLPYANAIGLIVKTSKIPLRPLENTLSNIREEMARYKSSPTLNFETEHKILTYDSVEHHDGFRNFNEAGYTHWAGWWSQSYGPITVDASGKGKAQVGAPADEKMREAIITHQAIIWKDASKPEFLANVKKAAAALGYVFPVTRPKYVPDPAILLQSELRKATTGDAFVSAVTNFQSYNFARVQLDMAAHLTETALKSNTVSLTGEQIEQVTGTLGRKNFSGEFFVALIQRAGPDYLVKSAVHSSILNVLKDNGAMMKAYTNIAMPDLLDAARRSGKGTEVIEAHLADPGLSTDNKMSLLKQLFEAAQTLDQHLSVVTRASHLLSSSQLVSLLDQPSWFGKIMDLAGSENRVEATVETLAKWLADPSQKSYSSLSWWQLSLSKSPAAFLQVLQAPRLAPVLQNPALLGEQLFFSLFVEKRPKPEDINALAALMPKQKDKVFIHSLSVIETREELKKLDLPGMFSMSSELKAKVNEWKAQHPREGFLSGLFGSKRSCKTALGD